MQLWDDKFVDKKYYAYVVFFLEQSLIKLSFWKEFEEKRFILGQLLVLLQLLELELSLCYIKECQYYKLFWE